MDHLFCSINLSMILNCSYNSSYMDSWFPPGDKYVHITNHVLFPVVMCHEVTLDVWVYISSIGQWSDICYRNSTYPIVVFTVVSTTWYPLVNLVYIQIKFVSIMIMVLSLLPLDVLEYNSIFSLSPLWQFNVTFLCV